MDGDLRPLVQRLLLMAGLPLLSGGCSSGSGDGPRVGGECAGSWGTQSFEGGCFSGPYTKTVEDYLIIGTSAEMQALYRLCIEGESCPEELCLETIDYEPVSYPGGSESFGALLECEPACLDGQERGVRVVYRLDGACTGRRPEGLCDDEAVPATTAGSWFAAAARLEAASVVAFNRLWLELAAHGAPSTLVSAARRAVREESRHARLMRTLARRYGAQPARPRIAPMGIRPLATMARENATEGCVVETFGAMIGSWQARASRDRMVRRAMGHIASDELGHASLAWQVDAWARTRLTPQAQRQLDHERAACTASLRASIELAPSAPDLTQVVGLPDRPTQRRLLDGLLAELC